MSKQFVWYKMERSNSSLKTTSSDCYNDDNGENDECSSLCIALASCLSVFGESICNCLTWIVCCANIK